MTIQEWEAETPDDLPDYVSDGENEVMQETAEEGPHDAPEEVPHDASSEESTDDDDSSPFLEVEFAKNHDDVLNDLGISPKKFDLLLNAFPNLCDGGPNTTFDAAAEANWAIVLAHGRPANMTEVLKKQKVIARLRKAIPRVVVTDVDDFAQVLDDNKTDDVPLPVMWRVLLLHPYVRRGQGSSLYFWEGSKWNMIVGIAGYPCFEIIVSHLFPDPADAWRIWLMVHGQGDDWLIMTEEDQIALQRLREELDAADRDLDNRRPERTVQEAVNDEIDEIIDMIVTQCYLGTEVPERDPFAWCSLQKQVHEACPRGCKCKTIFRGGEVKHAAAWDEIEKLNKIPLSTLLNQIGMESRDQGALLPGAWAGQSDLDAIRALKREDRTLLMNIRLRCNEFHEALGKGQEAIEQYRDRYTTEPMLDFINVGVDTVFMSIIKREIHLEMYNYKLKWSGVMELLSGKPYDHRARRSARLDRLEEETVALIASRATRLPRADDVIVRAVHVPEHVSPADGDSNSNSRQLNSEPSETSEVSALANYSAEELDAAASLLLLAAGGAGDDHGSDGEFSVSSTEGANGTGKGKRKRAEDMFDEDEAESKRQKS